MKKRPSKLETQLAMSIKFAKLQKRVSDLQAEVLQLGRKRLIADCLPGTPNGMQLQAELNNLHSRKLHDDWCIPSKQGETYMKPGWTFGSPSIPVELTIGVESDTGRVFVDINGRSAFTMSMTQSRQLAAKVVRFQCTCFGGSVPSELCPSHGANRDATDDDRCIPDSKNF